MYCLWVYTCSRIMRAHWRFNPTVLSLNIRCSLASKYEILSYLSIDFISIYLAMNFLLAANRHLQLFPLRDDVEKWVKGRRRKMEFHIELNIRSTLDLGIITTTMIFHECSDYKRNSWYFVVPELCLQSDLVARMTTTHWDPNNSGLMTLRSIN